MRAHGQELGWMQPQEKAAAVWEGEAASRPDIRQGIVFHRVTKVPTGIWDVRQLRWDVLEHTHCESFGLLSSDSWSHCRHRPGMEAALSPHASDVLEPTILTREQG